MKQLAHHGVLADLKGALEHVLLGKEEAVRQTLVCLIARGHLLIEDVPGVGKTTLAESLARLVDASFRRLQCTSDLLPGDITGVSIYRPQFQDFEFRPGPVFANFLLADEINRATPKTQSALLEAMSEGQVSVDGQTMPLPDPFMVIATQNPTEQQGTYALPESQLDRFLMRIEIGYPKADQERAILRGESIKPQKLAPLLNSTELRTLQKDVEAVHADADLVSYLLAIVEKSRHHDGVTLGVSPRGGQALYRAAQASALLDGRDFLVPDDIKQLAVPVFSHRLRLSAQASFGHRHSDSARRVIERILETVDVPL
ncbi:AAA family ATPase [Bryobacter aggregatus]|uniref:AAA family ATPase n=1 Tax=Bryobacter aggregatus TaxID=360054 RepID=UPI0004E2401F|nr:MoxR family ATPase [Bryobacter aggregatus]